MAGSWRTENGTEGGKDGDKTLEPKGPQGGPEGHTKCPIRANSWCVCVRAMSDTVCVPV